jgi:hypothetical protein
MKFILGFSLLFTNISGNAYALTPEQMADLRAKMPLIRPVATPKPIPSPPPKTELLEIPVPPVPTPLPTDVPSFQENTLHDNMPSIQDHERMLKAKKKKHGERE